MKHKTDYSPNRVPIDAGRRVQRIGTREHGKVLAIVRDAPRGVPHIPDPEAEVFARVSYADGRVEVVSVDSLVVRFTTQSAGWGKDW